MAKKFILDISKAQLPERYDKCIKRIPIEKGKYKSDWDFVREAISEEDWQLLKDACISGWRTDLPIGIDNEKLPIGAIIEVVE